MLGKGCLGYWYDRMNQFECCGSIIHSWMLLGNFKKIRNRIEALSNKSTKLMNLPSGQNVLRFLWLNLTSLGQESSHCITLLRKSLRHLETLVVLGLLSSSPEWRDRMNEMLLDAKSGSTIPVGLMTVKTVTWPWEITGNMIARE